MLKLTSIRLDRDDLQQLERIAKKKGAGITSHQLIRIAIQQYIKRESKGTARHTKDAAR
jgi:predicted transcriptional regulator